MKEVVLALGSNLGDRARNLQSSIAALKARGVRITRVSSVWETTPVPADQPPFLNATITGETTQQPHELLATIKAIEWELGRRPGRRWGPRPIDIDILFYGQERVDDADLTIPHGSIAERAFVLAPLADVWEEALPVFGMTARELLSEVDSTGVKRIALELEA